MPQKPTAVRGPQLRSLTYRHGCVPDPVPSFSVSYQNGRLFPPGLEPGTFRVLGERDNHYTTETGCAKQARRSLQCLMHTQSWLWRTRCSVRMDNCGVPNQMWRLILDEKKLVLPYDFPTMHTFVCKSGWPSGLRRCVQVAVWFSRRGFESHF